MLALQLLLAAFIGVPLALAAIAIRLHMRERRALLSAVRELPCPVCGGELSAHSLEAADELWRRHFAAIVERNPGMKFRMIRRLDAACQACGARLWFDQKARKFQAMNLVLAFEAETSSDVVIDSQR